MDTDHLREGKNLDAVHDITVAYPHNIPQTERHVLLKDFSKEIHFHVHRYPVDTLPTSKEDLQLWYHKWWEEKEERLCCFYWWEKTLFYGTGCNSTLQPWQEVSVLFIGCLCPTAKMPGARVLRCTAQTGCFGFKHSCRNAGQGTRPQGNCTGSSDTSKHTGRAKQPRRSAPPRALLAALRPHGLDKVTSQSLADKLK
eukprot:bmy_22529T0